VNPHRATRARQRGAALIAMLAVIVLGSSWWLVSALSTPTNRTALDAEHNARVLSQAKSALLGYVAHRALMAAENHPGRLPCPEAPGFQNNHDGTNYIVDDDGVAAGSCTLPAVGRLPWRTLGLDKLTDTAGEPLWYVVSPGWAFPFPGADPVINSNSAGQLTLDAQAAVALIIAPGKAFNVAAAGGCTARAQQRARQPNVAWDLRDFLECDNATSPVDAAFVSTGPRDSFNDQVVGVTTKEIWLHVEGPVAARIQRDVAPKLEAVYNKVPAACSTGSPAVQTNEWAVSFNCPSGTATNPVYPFAATFTDPSGSPFEGMVDLREGFIPLTASTCSSPMTDGRCDPAFVQWKTSPITATRAGGDANTGSATGDCTASTTSEIVCDFTYGKILCIGAILNGVCSVSGGTATITVTAQNVAMALRQHASPLPVSGISSASMTSPLIAAGADRGGASVTVQGTLPTITGCTMSVNLFGVYLCVGFIGISTTQTVRIPIGVFADGPLVNPPGGDPTYWFAANRWHHVTYYAVSAGHVATGSRDCVASANCLTLNVQNGAPLPNRRALIALAGRSLTGTVGSNRTLSDFLDTAENRDLDTIFEQNRVTNAFNDRFVSLSP
jgi:hypothetical protein